jgi:hypothetical protein
MTPNVTPVPQGLQQTGPHKKLSTMIQRTTAVLQVLAAASWLLLLGTQQSMAIPMQVQVSHGTMECLYEQLREGYVVFV